MSKNTCAEDFSHYSVMLDECIDGLNIKEDGIYCDLTLGGGGHSEKIAQKLKDGRLICVDTDITAIKAASARLEKYSDRITFVNNNFKNIEDILEGLGIEKIDGALIDLGVSSFQLDCAERGFSYMNDAPLDMRMNTSDPISAYDIVNSYSEEELKRIIYKICKMIANEHEKSLKNFLKLNYDKGNYKKIVKTKICSKCNQEKPLSSFWKRELSKDGTMNICSNCYKK